MRLILLLLLLSACQDFNSNTSDAGRYGPTDLDGSDPNFSKAYKVIQSRCISCHEHGSWSAYTDNEKWIATGMIVANDPDNSIFVQKIINAGYPISNMPYQGSALPNAEYELIRTWIRDMP